MVFGLVGAVLILFIEMTLYIIRACQTEYGEKHVKVSNVKPESNFSYIGQSAPICEIDQNEIFLAPDGFVESLNDVDIAKYISDQSAQNSQNK